MRVEKSTSKGSRRESQVTSDSDKGESALTFFYVINVDHALSVGFPSGLCNSPILVYCKPSARGYVNNNVK